MKKDRLPILLIRLGTLAIAISFLLFFLIFYSVIAVEVGYLLRQPDKNVIVGSVLYPVDEDFGIVIPKIVATAKIVANVDPYNEGAYQIALTKGVSHAKGTGFPGEGGNMFLFSHSSVNFFEAARYNSIFYLLDKLEKGDTIYIFYKKEKFIYEVKSKKIVDPSSVSYLSRQAGRETLTLMTCWPPGTTLKRLLVLAEIKH